MKTPDPNTVEETPVTHTTTIETDGIVSVVAGILPPATHQRFIGNGSSSMAVFEIVSAQHIVIENAYFSGEYPLIQYITSEDIGVAVNQPSGQMGFTGVGTADKEGLRLLLNVFYNTVDINTSGSVATLNLTSLQYKTDDGMYHSFNPAKIIASQSMCIVNNVPEILFQDPENHILPNGYKQIAKVVLTGDASWRLNALPLTLSSPFLRVISESQLIVKKNKDNIGSSDLIQLDPNSRIETVIHFDNGCTHEAGQKEVLKIYANTPEIGKPGNPIITNMYPLSSFVWLDGLGIKIPGNKNASFFKNETGRSVYDEIA